MSDSSQIPHGVRSKNRLRLMSQVGERHYLRNLRRILKYGLVGFGRNIWLSMTATIVMSFALLILFFTVIASLTLSSTADAMREKIDITIFFKPSTTAKALNEMKDTIESDQNVKSVTVNTSKQEYEKLISETKNNQNKELLTTLGDKEMSDIMIKSMQSTMRIKAHDPSDLQSIKGIVDSDPLFKKNLDPIKKPSYKTNNSAISTITSWSNIAKNGGLILSSVFLIVSVLVIFNTIRMAIYSRSEEIYMEKLVGADNHFIRGPFLVEAMFCGMLAGVISSGIGFLVFNLLAPNLTSYGIDVSIAIQILNSPKVILAVAAIIFAGIFIGLTSSRLAVHKYLKKI